MNKAMRVNKNTVYICFFKFRGDVYNTEVISPHFIKDGFWIRWNEGTPIESDDGTIWIPPSRILYVEKMEVKD